MTKNRGKDFESVIKKAFKKCVDIYILRLYDTMNGYSSVANPCDFIAFKTPKLFLLECKSCHGASLPVNNISDFQRTSLLNADKNYDDMIAGYIIWFIDKDVTVFVRATDIEEHFKNNKSLNYKKAQDIGYVFKGVKKKVFFDYNIGDFIKHYVNS